MPKDKIVFEACLKQSTPSSKPIKIGGEGEADILLETDSSQLAQVMMLITRLGEIFKVTIEEVKDGNLP